MTPNSWIKIFTDCGTVIGSILSFLDEIDLLQFERTYYRSSLWNFVPPDSIVTESQWTYLNELDQSKKGFTKWAYTTTSDQARMRRISRREGIEYARKALFAAKITKEAYHFYDFDRRLSFAGEVMFRGDQTMKAHERLNTLPSAYKHWYWKQWADPRELRGLHVFVDISIHKEKGNPSEAFSWKGFCPNRPTRSGDGIKIWFGLDSLAKEMKCKELSELRTFDDKDTSQQRLRTLMEKMQITVCRDSDDKCFIHTTSRNLVVST